MAIKVVAKHTYNVSAYTRCGVSVQFVGVPEELYASAPVLRLQGREDAEFKLGDELRLYAKTGEHKALVKNSTKHMIVIQEGELLGTLRRARPRR
jgi:hypothetical protein